MEGEIVLRISLPVEHGNQYFTNEWIVINRDKIFSSKIDKKITLKREIKKGLREVSWSYWDISWDMIDLDVLLSEVMVVL